MSEMISIPKEDFVMLAEALSRANEILTSLGVGGLDAPKLSKKELLELKYQRKLNNDR